MLCCLIRPVSPSFPQVPGFHAHQVYQCPPGIQYASCNFWNSSVPRCHGALQSMGLSQHLAPLSDFLLQCHALVIQIACWLWRRNEFDWRHAINVSQGEDLWICDYEHVRPRQGLWQSLPHVPKVLSDDDKPVAVWNYLLIVPTRFDCPVLVTFLGKRLVASFTHRVNSSIARDRRIALPARFTPSQNVSRWQCGLPAKFIDREQMSVQELMALERMPHKTLDGRHHNQ